MQNYISEFTNNLDFAGFSPDVFPSQEMNNYRIIEFLKHHLEEPVESVWRRLYNSIQSRTLLMLAQCLVEKALIAGEIIIEISPELFVTQTVAELIFDDLLSDYPELVPTTTFNMIAPSLLLITSSSNRNDVIQCITEYNIEFDNLEFIFSTMEPELQQCDIFYMCKPYYADTESILEHHFGPDYLLLEKSDNWLLVAYNASSYPAYYSADLDSYIVNITN